MTEPARVLLVDDDERVRHALGALIQRLPGCALAGSAASGAEAVAAIAKMRPDAVLLDAELPDALPTVALLRAGGAGRPALRLILLSTYGRAEHIAHASGADAYLLKGCGPCELSAALVGPRVLTRDE